MQDAYPEPCDAGARSWNSAASSLSALPAVALSRPASALAVTVLSCGSTGMPCFRAWKGPADRAIGEEAGARSTGPW